MLYVPLRFRRMKDAADHASGNTGPYSRIDKETSCMDHDKRTLPYFPLNISLLPGEDLPLRIFEPRYKQLINDCGEGKDSFGIPFLKNSEMQAFGSEVRVKQIVATNSMGEMVIVVEGLNNFEVVSFHDPLPGKTLQWRQDPAPQQ